MAENKPEDPLDFDDFSASFHTLFNELDNVKNATHKNNLRPPIICMLGNMMIGKTMLLDYLRKNYPNVHPTINARGYRYTKRNGATYFNIAKTKFPGLLFIDTPGFPSLFEFRSQGLDICDIAILVVDIIKALQPQTIKSLNLLKSKNTKFIVVLNKVDQISGWKSYPIARFYESYKKQSMNTKIDFVVCMHKIIKQLQERGIKANIFYQNREIGETVSIVPTSAISGVGISDLLTQLSKLIQKTMVEKLTYTEEFQCTVYDALVDEGCGTTIHVVLVSGILHVGDQIVVSGSQGQIVTTIQSFLLPVPGQELGVPGRYRRPEKVKGTIATMIFAEGLEHAIVGSDLYVKPRDDSKDNISHEQD